MLPVFCQTVPVDSTNHETVSPQHISKRKKRIWVLIISVAAVILFCFCLRFFYTPTKEMIAVNIFGGVGMQIAKENGHVDYPLVSVSDRGITLEVMEAVAGHDRVILLLRFSGQDETGCGTAIQPDDFNLILENGETCHPLAPQDYVVIDNGQTVHDDGSYSEYYEIPATILKAQDVRLSIQNICGIAGNWQLQLHLTRSPIMAINIHKALDIYGGTLTVKSVIIDAFSTTVEYTARGSFPYWDFYLTQFRSEQEVPALQKIRNSYKGEQIAIKTDGEKITLSDGSDGYTFVMPPIPEDACLTMDSRHLDHMEDVFNGTVNLKDYI